ncbi:MAG: hypothetical protein ABSF60_08935 [Verrucomicrobiota bacterium]|jgi:hypothetical protein
MSDSGKKSSSKTVVILWVVAVCFCAVLIVAIVIPNLVRTRVGGPPIPCVINLRGIDAAKIEWAQENSKTNGTIVTESDIKPYLLLDPGGNLRKCPQGGTYTIGKVGDKPTCSLGTNGNSDHILP